MKADVAKINRIGVLVGGGPAPGINSVIHAVTLEAHRCNCEVVGIYEGFRFLMEGRLVSAPLTPDRVAYIYEEGGSILKTSRANPTRSPEALRACAATLAEAGISALVSIGGDDTAFSASRVARYAQVNMHLDLRSVHVPKTIDNDLPLPDDIPTFGYETAREVGTNLVMNLKKDAATAQHWFLVLSMGRKAGHLALGIGKSASATITLIPEEWPGGVVRLHEVIDILVTTILLRLSQGKSYGIALIAEGILENLDREDLQILEGVERDEHGHIRLAEVNFLDLLKDELEKELGRLGVHGIRLVKHILGYEMRCAPPIAFDIEYTRNLGEAAVDFLIEGGNDAIITIQRNNIIPIPYDEMIDAETGRTEVRMVNTDSFRYRSAYNFMTRLKPEHLNDLELLNTLAVLTNLSAEEFKDRYQYLLHH
ncbi:MAG TPA: 6-phosphofructokinase [Anaerolineaceae bacterium]|nr:6-phosphofructokinase [Anaerolineaceae bacterium]